MRHKKLLTIVLLVMFLVGLGNIGIKSVSASVPNTPLALTPQGDIAICNNVLSSVRFVFTAVANANDYEIVLSKLPDCSIGLVWFTSNTNYVASANLQAGLWYWRVRARNNEGVSPWSSILSFHVIPSAPVLVSPPNNGFTLPNTTFTWTTCFPFETEFQLSNRPDFSSILISLNYTASQGGWGESHLYEDKFFLNLPCGMYWWRVRSKLGTEFSSWVSQMFIVTVPPTVSPEILSPAQSIIADTSINLKWSYVSSADRYQIQICHGSNYLLDTIITGTSYAFKGQDNTDYSFRVRAGNQVGWGPWSEWRNFTILLPPATPILDSIPLSLLSNNNKIILKWFQPSSTVDYWILEIWDLTDKVKSEYQVRDNSFSFIGQYFHSYQFRVRALNQSGSSGWSNWLGPLEFKENIPPVLVLNDYPTLTNQTVITISGKASDEGSGLSKLYCNGQLISVNNDGTFQVSLTLQEGVNSFTFLAVDFAANKTQQSIEIQKDTIPPEIIINFPSSWSADAVNTVISDITLKGQIKDSHPVSLLINNQTVTLENGYFSFATSLNYGPNKIYLKASDAAGNVTERIITLAKILAVRKIELQVNNPVMKIYQINEAGQIIAVSREIDSGRGTVPVIREGRTFLPIRALIETIGGSVKWNAQLRQVTITLPYRNTTIDLWINKNWARITDSYGNVSWKQIEVGNSKVVPFIKNDRTYLPLRFIAETLGFKVNWDGVLEIISVEFPLIPSS